VTTLVHGAAEFERAESASRALFGQGDLRELDEATLAAALEEVGTPVQIPAAAGLAGSGSLAADASVLPSVTELMAQAGIVPSRSAARRAVAEGGAYLNNRKVTDENEAPTSDDLLHGRFLVLRRGKRTIGGVEVLTGEPPAGAS